MEINRFPLFSVLLLLSGCPDSGASAADGSIDASPHDTGGDQFPAESADDGAAGANVQRKFTVVFAMPDLPPQYLCVGGLLPDANGAPTDQLVQARGPFGLFDPNDPTHLGLMAGFPYGAIVSLPIRLRDAPLFDDLAPVAFVVDEVQPKQFAGFGVDSETCKTAFVAAKATPWRMFAVNKGQIGVGQSWMTALTGCEAASSDPVCAGGNNARALTTILDTSPPTSFEGNGELELGIQFASLSPFAAFQNVDVYLRPGSAPSRADAGEGDAQAVLIAGGSAGLRWGDITQHAIGVRLGATQTAGAVLVVVPHGQLPCSADAGCATATVTVPIDPSVKRYGSPSGGSTGAGWAGNQVFAVFGRVPLDAQEPPSSVVRLGIFSAEIP